MVATDLPVDLAYLGDDEVVTRTAAGYFLGVSASSLEEWVRKGRGPEVVRAGGVGYPLYRMGELRRFKAEYRPRRTARSIAA